MGKMSQVQFLDLKAAYDELASEIDAAVSRVCRSGWYIGGAEVESFEQNFANYTQAQHCVGVGNGLDALILALRALDIGAGDEVLVEDLGSANGTWINGKRISRGQARHGDEIRFDKERFQLVVPGQVVASPKTRGVRADRRWILLTAAFAVSASVVVLVLLRG